MNALPGQLELATVIDHKQYKASYSLQADMDALMAIEPPRFGDSTHKPAGVRLAKMLSKYDDSPSSQLWSDIQRLAREILKA
jgi:hypothetical protein